MASMCSMPFHLLRFSHCYEPSSPQQPPLVYSVYKRTMFILTILLKRAAQTRIHFKLVYAGQAGQTSMVDLVMLFTSFHCIFAGDQHSVCFCWRPAFAVFWTMWHKINQSMYSTCKNTDIETNNIKNQTAIEHAGKYNNDKAKTVFNNSQYIYTK